jgi:uncharacterized Zn finger protein
MSHTSWSDAWLDAFHAFSHPGRMRRGRHFAKGKLIKNLDIKPGEISADVKDQRKTYHVTLQFPPLDDASWEKIMTRMAEQALYSARLLAGELPPEVMDLFADTNAALFPTADKLEASCTCPDWEVPCKHVAGVYYHLAEHFEKNPFLLFYFRGRSKEDLLNALRTHRPDSDTDISSQASVQFAEPPLEQTLTHFWEIGPEIKTITFNISPPTQPLPHFKRLGRPTFTEMDLYALLKPVYETITEKTISWANTKSEKYRD